MFVSHLYVFFGEMSSSLAHLLIGSFIFLELSWRSCLYIFAINPLSVASLAIIFSQSEGCLFTVLTVSFVVQKLLSFIRSHLFLLLFPVFWEVGHKGSSCDLCQYYYFLSRILLYCSTQKDEKCCCHVGNSRVGIHLTDFLSHICSLYSVPSTCYSH